MKDSKFILVAAVLSALLAFHAVEAKHYTVKVADKDNLQQVAQTLKQRGFKVKHINRRFSFISVQIPDAGGAATTAAAVDTATPLYQQAASTSQCSLIGDTDANTPLFANGQNAANCAAAGPSSGQPTIPTFPGPPPADQASAAAASDAVIVASLSNGIPGIVIEEDPQLYLTARNLKAAAAQQQEVLPAASCPPGLDGQIGRVSEDVPYGIKMVQAIDPDMIEVSNTHKDKVMFCVIDTGVDTRNFEFNKETTSGCVPNTARADGTNTSCMYDFNKDYAGHGTHTSGTIAAMRNGKAIVGVSAEGAYLYHYNAFGPAGGFALSDLIGAIQDCLGELDSKKAKTNTPDMKLVVSMSFGAGVDTRLAREAVTELARERAADMLLVAAGGNGALEGAVYSYPASWPEVVAVAAVNWAGVRAEFSQINDKIDWAAPGVQTLSTIPLAGSAGSSYNSMPSLTLTSAADTSSDLLTNPAPHVMGGAKTGTVTGQLIDCGLGQELCGAGNATGRVCLIQRGENTFCEKITNCVKAGGVGALLFGREDQPDCESFDGSLQGGCSTPKGGWPVALTISKGQGLSLRTLIEANPGLTVSLDSRRSHSPLPLDFMSGTSMATPTAAGVAGLVWSSHTDCSAAELRAAISWSATDLGPVGYDAEYGHGLVQAAAAHNYLQANPCTGGDAKDPPKKAGGQETPDREKPQILRKLELTSDAADNSAEVGSTVKLTAKVSRSTDKQKVDGVTVRLAVRPASRLSCDSARLVTDAAGVATATCTLLAPGDVAVRARMGAGSRAVEVVNTFLAVEKRNTSSSP